MKFTLPHLLFTLVSFSMFSNATFSQNLTPVNIILTDSNKFDSLSLSKLKFATQTLEEVFNSDGFRQAVLNENFNVGNNNLSASQIYEIIISGMDNYINKPKDNSIDIRLDIFDRYYGHNNFGITDMETRITRTHRCYILENDLNCYVSHLAHEYMHQIGFYDKRSGMFGTGTKTKSVPYKIGNIVDKLISNSSFCRAINRTCTL